MTETLWMIRAGKGGALFGEFSKGFIGIEWEELGDLGGQLLTEDEIKKIYSDAYPKRKGETAVNSALIVHRFHSVIETGDPVMTYNPNTREYLIGRIGSDYMYWPGKITGRPHIRAVRWEGALSREALSADAREALRSNLPLFQVHEEIAREILALLAGEPILTPEEIIEQQIAKKEAQRRRITRGWISIGFGIFILALGVVLYVYASGQTHYLEELEAGEVESVTIFFWLGEEINKASPEYDDALDLLVWLKRVALGAGIVGAIMILAGTVRIIFPRSGRLKRIVYQKILFVTEQKGFYLGTEIGS